MPRILCHVYYNTSKSETFRLCLLLIKGRYLFLKHRIYIFTVLIILHFHNVQVFLNYFNSEQIPSFSEQNFPTVKQVIKIQNTIIHNFTPFPHQIFLNTLRYCAHDYVPILVDNFSFFSLIVFIICVCILPTSYAKYRWTFSG